MNPPATKLFLLCFFFFLKPPFLQPSLADTISFDFPSFTLRNLTLLGDSYLRNGAIGLTRELGVPSSSSGRVLYDSPVEFSDPRSNATASFSSRFSFSITNVNPNSYGDGLAFFVSSDNGKVGSTGAFLGLFNSSSNPTKNELIAIEFDTFLDTQFGDPNSNHVGLDVGNLSSVEAVDAGSAGIDLKSGNLITAWVEYKHAKKVVSVWLSYSSFKPEKPLMSVKIDLSKHFHKFMYVGFSGSTEGSTELHVIEEWSFRTFDFRLKPPSPPLIPWIRPTIPVPNPPKCKNHYCLSGKLILTLEVTGLIVICLITGFSSWFLSKNWKKIRPSKRFKLDLIKSPRQFSYRELSVATKGFNNSKIVGCGAFGTVYRGVLRGSDQTVAVKRSKHAHEGKSEFIAELSIIACLRHKNLVQLQGWCSEKNRLLLVYEFMPNGSLDRALYEHDSRLEWGRRYNIAIGIASVLAYLHQECEQQVIHRDIKTSNILLDSNFNARLGDFGLAKIADHNKSPDSTLTAGTMGYLAPEYLQSGKATEKTDVYSFGVVMLELACGKRPIEKDQNQKMFNLVDWVWGLHSEDRLVEAADQRLNGEFESPEMARILLVGLCCANPDCAERPSMRKVLQILNGEVEIPVVPRSKPILSFTSSLPLSLQEIVCDSEQSVISSPLYELNFNQ